MARIQLFCTQLSVIHCLLSGLMHAYQFLSMHSGWIWHCIFFPMSPGSVCNKSSAFRLNHSSLDSDLHDAAWRSFQGLFHSSAIVRCKCFIPWLKRKILVCLFEAHTTQVECLGVEADNPVLSLSKQPRTEKQVAYVQYAFFFVCHRGKNLLKPDDLFSLWLRNFL